MNERKRRKEGRKGGREKEREEGRRAECVKSLRLWKFVIVPSKCSWIWCDNTYCNYVNNYEQDFKVLWIKTLVCSSRDLIEGLMHHLDKSRH
jgi:hypothetical protein